jgi:hypothetical protein
MPAPFFNPPGACPDRIGPARPDSGRRRTSTHARCPHSPEIRRYRWS